MLVILLLLLQNFVQNLGRRSAKAAGTGLRIRGEPVLGHGDVHGHGQPDEGGQPGRALEHDAGGDAQARVRDVPREGHVLVALFARRV